MLAKEGDGMSHGSRSTFSEGEGVNVIEPSTPPKDRPAESGGANGFGLYEPKELKPLADPGFWSEKGSELEDGRALG